MKRFPILGILLLVPAMLMLGMTGCTNKTTPTPPKGDGADPTKDKTDDGKAKGGKTEITTALKATVKGTVKYKGTPPKVEIDPRIADHKTDAKFCMSGPEKFKEKQEWMVGKDNALANVVVFLAPPAGKKFKITDDLKKSSKKTVTVDQPFCNYDPHVVAVWPEEQGVVFLNSASVPHNVKIAFSKLNNPDITMKPKPNDGEPSKSEELFFKGAGEQVIDAVCNMHSWMNCKIVTFNSPYFAVTKADGTFEIPNVPIDEELTVYFWHESLGRELTKDRQKAATHKTTEGVNDLKVLEFSPK